LSVVCCRNRYMNLAVWAECNGVAGVAAYSWFRAGLLPVWVRKVGRLGVGERSGCRDCSAWADGGVGACVVSGAES
jgi:hypothetical protein